MRNSGHVLHQQSRSLQKLELNDININIGPIVTVFIGMPLSTIYFRYLRLPFHNGINWDSRRMDGSSDHFMYDQYVIEMHQLFVIKLFNYRPLLYF